MKNIIIIDFRLHNEFHSWMRGTEKSCTAEDFLEWIQLVPEDIFGEKNLKSLQAEAIANIKQRIQYLRPILDSMEASRRAQ